MSTTTCNCGCGGTPARGLFLPGHDQKLRTRLEEAVGGLQSLARLVDASEQYAAGKLPLEALGRVASAAFLK